MPDHTSEKPVFPSETNLDSRIGYLEEGLLELRSFGDALQQSEKRYRRLFESAKDGILILNAETGKVVDINPFLLDLLGLTYSAAYGQHIWDLGVFKDIAASKEAFKTLQCNEYIRYEDLPLETLHGKAIAVEFVSNVYEFHGKAIAVEFVSNVYLVDNAKVIQCNIRDITERKKAEAERKRLMTAIEQVGESIIITDSQGIIQFVNPAFEQVTGYPRGEIVGKTPGFLKSGKQDEAFYRALWETISGGNTWSGCLVNRRRDGTFFTGETTISPVRDLSNNIINYVAVQRDITEHLRLASQIHQSQKMEAIGLLAGGVAHDYNNMLGVILGNTELSMKKLGLNHPIQVHLSQVYQAAMRSAEITRQLLAYSRRQAITPLVLDLNASVASMQKMLRPLIGENIDLVWQPAGAPCMVKMDPCQIHQILVNLCVNARDAIADVGKVTVSTGVAEFDETACAEHAGYLPGEYVFVGVADDGCGMDHEVVSHLFEPFFTTKDVGKGTGLGLATVYGIVHQNNGFIDVHSEPGKGTSFHVFLPRCREQAVDPQQEKKRSFPRGSGESILVVEDEPAILAIAKVMLEELGYRITTASAPEDALDQLGAGPNAFRLLITDLVMPGMNGWDLSQRLKTTLPDLRILFMSGYFVHPDPSVKGKMNGRVNFLQKPFSMMDLAVKVREALEEPSRSSAEK